MPSTHSGVDFESALVNEILSWEIPNLEIYRQPFVGSRFVGKKRYLDIVLKYNDKTLGIEAKSQLGAGTTDQKLIYTLEDAQKTPIPVIIVFSGDKIEQDIKTLLVSSGKAIEVKWNPDSGLEVDKDIFKQRILIELGLDWLNDQRDKRVNPDAH
jgi:hypothetical protein